MWWIYDGIVIAVLALFVWLGWRKGLLLSLCGLAAAVVAFLGAGIAANVLSAPAADLFVPQLEAVMEERIALHDDSQDIRGAVDALREDNGLFSWAADALEDALDDAQDAAPDLSQIVSTAAQFVAQRVAHSVIFVLAFVILYVLLIVLLHALDLVAKLPVLHFCNGLGGGAIGLVKGILIVLVAVAALMSSAYQPDGQTLEASYVLRFFVENDPILTLFKG